MINDYLSLSTRAGFNKSLAHFRTVTDIIKQLDQGDNLADIVDALEKNHGVEKAQIAPLLNAVVIDRMGYSTLSFNLPVDVPSFEEILAELQKWNRVDIVIAYHHPQLGINLINPKHKEQWEAVRELNRDELVVLYVRALDDDDKALESSVLSALHDLLVGRPVSGTAKFGGASPAVAHKPPSAEPPPEPPPPMEAKLPAAPLEFRQPPPAASPGPAATPQAPDPAPPAPATSPGPGVTPQPSDPAPPAPAKGGKMRMTPKYNVQVSNELFHNGNVEAWKNIVDSYKTKFPGLDVHIFHDGQKVNNINALFKWGKVKHGDVILFCVSGEEIKGVSKLQRYLYEGASVRYESYLKKDVNKVLNLF